jgi:beta-lactamase class D
MDIPRTALALARALAAIAAIALPLATRPARAAEPDYAAIFKGRDGCFTLYDMSRHKVVVRVGEKACAESTSPCSTFKVPLALMAFDAGIWKDEKAAIKWDGTRYSRDAWNGDQTPATWMSNSVVWVSQGLTPQLGMDRIKSRLKDFAFGNQDMSGGLTRAWLMSTLTISPDEQITFWRKFWRGQLGVSKPATEITKKITLVDTSEKRWILHGKTGSGSIGEKDSGDDTGYQLGWFVGHLAREDREYVFATRFTDREKNITHGPAGWTAREMTKEILSKLDLY